MEVIYLPAILAICLLTITMVGVGFFMFKNEWRPSILLIFILLFILMILPIQKEKQTPKSLEYQRFKDCIVVVADDNVKMINDVKVFNNIEKMDVKMYRTYNIYKMKMSEEIIVEDKK